MTVSSVLTGIVVGVLMSLAMSWLRRVFRRAPPHLRGRIPAEGTEAPPGLVPMNARLVDMNPVPVEPRLGTPLQELNEWAYGRCARLREVNVPAEECLPTAIAEGRRCIIRKGRDW